MQIMQKRILLKHWFLSTFENKKEINKAFLLGLSLCGTEGKMISQ